MRNYTIEELAEIIVESILSEQFLNRKTLVPKVAALIRTTVDLKNTPKNYNAYETKTSQAQRLRTIEQRGLEIRFWHDLVKRIDACNMENHYKQKDAFLAEKGFPKS